MEYYISVCPLGVRPPVNALIPETRSSNPYLTPTTIRDSEVVAVRSGATIGRRAALPQRLGTRAALVRIQLATQSRPWHYVVDWEDTYYTDCMYICIYTMQLCIWFLLKRVPFDFF